ncbi:hypothetical protein BJ508DRAFT_125344 [Ascobolus immersus RN42]|uniref:Uncharacterized protein n=1 Tax=Ascobolus immersus RN42 TaxID=1160509 RepID=A0A3N4I7X8_ASCIM|nr:hypothetical protein BJ508DRAFT_125344 [Ascobolus immersus RN42]
MGVSFSVSSFVQWWLFLFYLVRIYILTFMHIYPSSSFLHGILWFMVWAIVQVYFLFFCLVYLVRLLSAYHPGSTARSPACYPPSHLPSSHSFPSSAINPSKPVNPRLRYERCLAALPVCGVYYFVCILLSRGGIMYLGLLDCCRVLGRYDFFCVIWTSRSTAYGVRQVSTWRECHPHSSKPHGSDDFWVPPTPHRW